MSRKPYNNSLSEAITEAILLSIAIGIAAFTAGLIIDRLIP